MSNDEVDLLRQLLRTQVGMTLYLEKKIKEQKQQQTIEVEIIDLYNDVHLLYATRAVENVVK